jgi:hypothetical protein
MTTMTASFRLAAAEAFVLANGNPRQCAYWKAAFGYGPVEVWLFEVEEQQSQEGQWGAGLADTAAALRWLAWLNLGEDVFEVLPRTLRYLEANQQADGSWGTVGDTVAIAAYLAFMAEAPELVERATAYVAAHQAELKTLQQQALGFALLRERSLYDALSAAVNGAELPSATLALIHEGCVQAGLPAGDALREAISRRLLPRQQADGSFAADDPAVDTVETTVFASRVLMSR